MLKQTNESELLIFLRDQVGHSRSGELIYIRMR